MCVCLIILCKCTYAWVCQISANKSETDLLVKFRYMPEQIQADVIGSYSCGSVCYTKIICRIISMCTEMQQSFNTAALSQYHTSSVSTGSTNAAVFTCHSQLESSAACLGVASGHTAFMHGSDCAFQI